MFSSLRFPVFLNYPPKNIVFTVSPHLHNNRLAACAKPRTYCIHLRVCLHLGRLLDKDGESKAVAPETIIRRDRTRVGTNKKTPWRRFLRTVGLEGAPNECVPKKTRTGWGGSRRTKHLDETPPRGWTLLIPAPSAKSVLKETKVTSTKQEIHPTYGTSTRLSTPAAESWTLELW